MEDLLDDEISQIPWTIEVLRSTLNHGLFCCESGYHSAFFHPCCDTR